MVRAARIATAATLMAALACLPVVLDQCSGSCETHQTDAAAAPPCHHAHDSGAQIGHAPAACDHDHTASIAALRGAPSVPQHSIDTLAAAATQMLPVNRHAWNVVSTHAPPGSAGSVHGRSLPLRV